MATEPTEQQATAEAVSHELDIGHGIVNPFEAAGRLGLEVVRFPPSPQGTLEGAYRPTELGGHIYVNSGAAFVRQRFTMAHELGHHRLHGGTTYLRSEIDAQDDWEANRFAEAFRNDPVGVRPFVQRASTDAEMVA